MLLKHPFEVISFHIVLQYHHIVPMDHLVAVFMAQGAEDFMRMRPFNDSHISGTIITNATANVLGLFISTVRHIRIISMPQKVNKLRKPCYTTTVDESRLFASVAQRGTRL
jgi:signal transduction histidine kinase